MRGNIKILVVEDDEKMCELLKKVFSKKGYRVEISYNGKEGLKKLEDTYFDLVLADIRMPEMNGMELLKAAKEIIPDITIILMTAFGSIELAVEAIKKGAYDYIAKPFKMEEILLLVDKAIEERKLRQELHSLRQEVMGKYRFGNLIGKSKAMREVFELIRRVSSTKVTVLIYGKSGTGKELVAKAIHYNSPYGDKPFVPINCSAIPESLLESELFGHVKGAFTGAITTRKGLIEEAHGGTLFLDEIGELPLGMQTKLLRFLQDKEIRPIGGKGSVKVDVRLIAATNKDLREAIKRREFREDLFYRLNVITIELPLLADRPEDIPLLVNHFLEKFSEGGKKKVISKEAMAVLTNYSWSGNVRELENCIERALTLSKGEEILPEDLILSQEKEDSPLRFLSEILTLDELEKGHIANILQNTNGHRIKAAKLLGIDRRTLYRKIKRYHLPSEA